MYEKGSRSVEGSWNRCGVRGLGFGFGLPFFTDEGRAEEGEEEAAGLLEGLWSSRGAADLAFSTALVNFRTSSLSIPRSY
jgi:hypothetical protein